MKFERLGDIITIKKGKKPLFSDAPSSESIRVIQIDDLRNDNNIKYTDEKNGVFANEDDVLLAWDGANAGTIGYGKKGYIGSTIALLRINIPENYSSIFIGKFLQSQFDYLRSKSTGATIPHIDGKSLRDLTIPKIPISDQNRIAEILSKAESLISQRKQSINLLDELSKSTFLKIFGDPKSNNLNFPVAELKEEIEIIGGSQPPKSVFINKELPGYVRLIQIRDYKSDKYLTYIPMALSKRNCLIDDIMIGRYGPPVFQILRGIEGSYNVALMKAVPSANLTKEYVFHLLKTGYIQDIIIKNSQRTAGQTGVNLKLLNSLKIVIPPMKLQMQFGAIVKNIDVLKNQYQHSLTELQNMYGDLSQKAFKGELSLDKNKRKEIV